MKKPNLYRLSKLLRHMRSNKRIHEYFDFTTFNETVPFLILKEDQHKHVKHCGTHGCMAGELPGIWKSWYFDEEGKLCFIKARLTIRQAIAIWFNLSRNEVFILFYPNTVGLVKGQLPIRATLREVTKNLENFIDKSKSGKKKVEEKKVEKFPCPACEVPAECIDLEYCPKKSSTEMSKVNRSTYQKAIEENKRLLADIQLLVQDGFPPSVEKILCIKKWREKFNEEKDFNLMLKQVARKYIKDHADELPEFLTDKLK